MVQLFERFSSSSCGAPNILSSLIRSDARHWAFSAYKSSEKNIHLYMNLYPGDLPLQGVMLYSQGR